MGITPSIRRQGDGRLVNARRSSPVTRPKSTSNTSLLTSLPASEPRNPTLGQVSRRSREQLRPTATRPRGSALRRRTPGAGAGLRVPSRGPRRRGGGGAPGPAQGPSARSRLQGGAGLTAAPAGLSQGLTPRHLPGGPHGQGPALDQGLPGRCRPAANALTSATGAPRASIRRAVERRAPDGRAPGAGWGRELGDGWERSTRPRPRFLSSLRLNLRVWAAGDAQAGMPWCSRPGPLSVDSARVRWAGAAGSQPPT